MKHALLLLALVLAGCGGGGFDPSVPDGYGVIVVKNVSDVAYDRMEVWDAAYEELVWHGWVRLAPGQVVEHVQVNGDYLVNVYHSLGSEVVSFAPFWLDADVERWLVVR